jgi:hypothetical protein
VQLGPHFFLNFVSPVQLGLHCRQFFRQIPQPGDEDDGNDEGNHGYFHARGNRKCGEKPARRGPMPSEQEVVG